MSEQIYENMARENNALRDEIAVLKEELALANEQIEWFKRQIFGRKTEQTSVVIGEEFGVQLSMFGNTEEKAAPAKTVTAPWTA